MISGTVRREQRITGTVRAGGQRISGVAYRATRAGGTPYDGPYEMTPEFDAQIMQTKNKTMTDNVTVRAIPISRTTNPQGGITVYIGEIEDA